MDANQPFSGCPVTDRQIASCLALHYGLALKRLTFLPLSHAGDTWVFRAETTDSLFFLKVKRSLPAPGIAVSAILHAHGLPAVVPVLSRSGHAFAPLADYFLMLFPFIEGSPILPATLSKEDWSILGTILRKLHGTSLPASVQASLAYERFAPRGESALLKIASVCTSDMNLDPAQQSFRELWRSSADLPSTFFAFVQRRGHVALRTQPRACLCHGDFQPGNILRSTSGEFLLVDWDNPVWAPPQRDLMFIDAAYHPYFEAGYGPLITNRPAAEYLQADWLLQEFFDYAGRLFFRPSVTNEERQWALGAVTRSLDNMREVLRNAS